MNYLERNKALIEEIRNCHELKIGKEISRSEADSGMGAIVYSLGNYASRILNNELHLILKDKETIRPSLERFVSRDLGLFRVIESRFLHLLPEFPIVYGMVLDADGQNFGFLSEDFTEGGKYEIKPEYMDAPFELANAFGHTIDETELATTSFCVNGKRRIGDFGEFYSGLSIRKWDEIIPARDISQNIQDFTVRLKE